MQSSDYVPGVSGWKIDKNLMEFNGGPWGPTYIGDLGKAPAVESDAVESSPKPFIVVDGATYISQAEVERASITKAQIRDMWSLKMQVNDHGQYVTAGIGLGIESQFLASAEKFAIKEPTDFEKALAKGAGAVLELLASSIKDTDLGADFLTPIADQVRDVIRDEIKPGGLLHRN
ncbi:phage tail tip fiber protein [Pseudomonas sp. P2758]|uniref:phage tail tip fiber protein n=1 Tax=unclassified Pseudomonas TaxID=196821 RepID=UPI003B59611A